MIITKQLQVIDYISAAATTTKTYTVGINNVHGLKIKNDGASSLTVTVNGLVMTVLAAETFDEAVQPTDTFTITATTAFRCFVRGV